MTTLSEAELVNAICLHMAERKDIRPDRVSVELIFDDELGYSAEVQAGGRTIVWIQANLQEAVSRYMLKKYNLPVFPDQISFRLAEEIVVDIR